MCSNLVKIIPGATLYHFGVLSSLMHMIWVRYVAGRLESRYRYSIKLVYNNFPWPTGVTESKERAVATAAESVLSARTEYNECSLAALYDPRSMPQKLLKAHRNLDKKVDLCYRRQAFARDADRIDYLLDLYVGRTQM